MDAYFKFSKVDESKRQVFGWAYIAIDKDGHLKVDLQDDFIDTVEELEKAAYPFVRTGRRGDSMHIKKDIATLVESVVFTPEKIEKMGVPPGILPQLAWWVGYQVEDDPTWELVRTGVLKGFSIGGSGKRSLANA